MLRGRIMSANGIKADDIKAQPNAAWVLQSDRGITFATEVPRGSTVVEGDWWSADYKGPPLVSFEKKIADGLGLKVGDPIVVNVLGRNIEARIANLRAVNWENLGINFVLVFSPSAFAGAPHTDIATLTYPGGGTLAQETALLKAVSDAFPAVTTVRVKDAIEAVGDIVRNLVLGGARRQRWWRWSPRCWCSAARSRPATAIASTTRSCSRRSAPRAAS